MALYAMMTDDDNNDMMIGVLMTSTFTSLYALAQIYQEARKQLFFLLFFLSVYLVRVDGDK